MPKNKIPKDYDIFMAVSERSALVQPDWHWFSLIVGLKTLPDNGLTEKTKLKEFFPS